MVKVRFIALVQSQIQRTKGSKISLAKYKAVVNFPPWVWIFLRTSNNSTWWIILGLEHFNATFITVPALQQKTKMALCAKTVVMLLGEELVRMNHRQCSLNHFPLCVAWKIYINKTQYDHNIVGIRRNICTTKIIIFPATPPRKKQ